MTAHDNLSHAFTSMWHAIAYEADGNALHAAHAYTVASWCAATAGRIFTDTGDSVSAAGAYDLARECREHSDRVYKA